MCILANSEDPDEMLHNVALNQNLQLAKTKRSSEKKYNFYLEIIPCDPWIYIMDHPKFIVSNKKEESISAQRVLIKKGL